MVRILVYPNITYQHDLEKDSYIQVIKKQISLLNEIRDDLWFYLILPKEVESLSFPNTTQLIYPLPTYPPAMRSHFNVGRFKKLIPHSLDIDGAIYDVVGETPTYWFRRSQDGSYKESEEYDRWLELLKRQDKKDKKVIATLMNKRLG